MREFRLTEKKTIYLVLADVLSEKKFFLVYDVTIAACFESLSFQQIFSSKEKKRCIVSFLFLFLFEGRQF